MAGANDKTEKATPKRAEEARKKGQVGRSADLNGAVVMLAGLFLDDVAVAVVGVALGSLSLGAALVWRSQLIEAWRRQQGGQTGGRR